MRGLKGTKGQLHLFFAVADFGGGGAVQLGLDLPKPGPKPGAAPSQTDWRAAAGNATASLDEALRSADGVGERWAETLRRLYPPPHTRKRVAAAFACEARTAKGWLSGQAPEAKRLALLAALHGPAAALAVLAPGAARRAELEARLSEMTAALGRLRDQLGEAA